MSDFWRLMLCLVLAYTAVFVPYFAWYLPRAMRKQADALRQIDATARAGRYPDRDSTTR